MKDYDVAVVGGGLLGSAFGYGLAALGLRTAVLDEGDNAIRTARGNFGLVWVQGKGHGMPGYARWSLQSARLWQDLAGQLKEETGVDAHLHQPGGFTLCLDEAEMSANLELMAALQREAGDPGYPYEVLDHARLKRELPAIGDIPGAIYTPNDGHCNPLRLLRALHAGFRFHGGAYLPGAPVARITPSEPGGFELRDSRQRTLCVSQKVVIAAGHGSKTLGGPLGLDVPTHPDQGQVLVTEPVRPLLSHPTNYVRQTDDGNLLLGASTRDAGFDLSTEPGTLRDIARRCCRAFPLLRDLRLQRCWAPVTDADGASDQPGIWVAGDGAGIGGAEAAVSAGRLSGRRLAATLGFLDKGVLEAMNQADRRRLARLARRRRFLDGLYRPLGSFQVPPEDDTVVCRCEEVTAGEIRRVAAMGCMGPNQGKAFTRCGMGPCMGRKCGNTVSQILADFHQLPVSEIGHYRIRPPVRPITIGQLADMEQAAVDATHR